MAAAPLHPPYKSAAILPTPFVAMTPTSKKFLLCTAVRSFYTLRLKFPPLTFPDYFRQCISLGDFTPALLQYKNTQFFLPLITLYFFFVLLHTYSHNYNTRNKQDG
jgi:hypothetical protein